MGGRGTLGGHGSQRCEEDASSLSLAKGGIRWEIYASGGRDRGARHPFAGGRRSHHSYGRAARFPLTSPLLAAHPSRRTEGWMDGPMGALMYGPEPRWVRGRVRGASRRLRRDSF